MTSIAETRNATASTSDLARLVSGLSTHAVRFSIALVLVWIGAMKFTAYEAGAIEGLVASSPFTSWLYSVTSLQGASNLIGTVEILTAAGLIAGLKFPKIGLLAALAATGTFLLTLSFILTAPGWKRALGASLRSPSCRASSCSKTPCSPPAPCTSPGMRFGASPDR